MNTLLLLKEGKKETRGKGEPGRGRNSVLSFSSGALSAVLCFAIGCATSPGNGGGSSSGRQGIDALHIFSLPLALDLDGVPGPDGFGVTLYASAVAPAKGVPITSGSVEILMFDGVLSADTQTNAAPRRVWSYTSAELKRYVIKTSLGTGYRFTPRWGDTPPLQNRISIVARYVPPRDTPIQSAPTTISVSAK